MGDAGSTPTNILRLHQDLLVQCLRHLSATERVSVVPRVCRAWRRIVFGSSLLWPRMGLWLATSKTSSTGDFGTLLDQLRLMGETTTGLELLLGPPCYEIGETSAEAKLVLKMGTPAGVGDPVSWTGFNLGQLLAAFPRLRALRLIQIPPSARGHSYTAFAPGLSLAQLSALCRSCTGLVELGLNPVCVFLQDLESVVACLARLPHLRCLSMAINFLQVQQGPGLQCLSSLTRLRELRCVVYPEWYGDLEKTRKALSGFVNLEALELTGVRWLLTRGPLQGFSLPPGLTRLAVRECSWELLLPKLSAVRLQSLSVWLDKDDEYDLGSVTCLTQLTQLVGAPTWHSNPGSFGGGLVLPQVQRLALDWGGDQGLPPVVDWASLAHLTYLCLKTSGCSGAGVGMDLRRLAKLKVLVLQGFTRPLGALPLPSSLVGLQLEECYQEHLSECLVNVPLCTLILLDCPNISWKSANFRGTMSQLRSLRRFHCYQTIYHTTCMGDSLPDTEEAQREWARGVELEFRLLLPWLEEGACTVSIQSDWDRDGSGRPAACLKRQADPNDLFNLLRVYGKLR